MSKNSEKVDILISGISTRVNEIATKVGGKKELAKMTGISESQLHRYVSGDHDLKLTVLAAMANAGQVSIEWLATGKELGTKGISQEDMDDFALIPGYNVQVSAGNGTIPGSEQPSRRLAFRHRWLKYRGLNEKDLVMVFTKGDSMEPTIADNNTLMVDTSDTDPQDGGIYVIRNDGHLLVKRTQIAPGQGVWLISDNKEYDKLLVQFDKTEDLEVIGKVVWIGKDM